MRARSEDRNEENPRRFRFETAGTLVSLRGQATFGKPFPEAVWKLFSRRFSNRAQSLKNRAVAGRETAQLLISRRWFVHLLPHKDHGFFFLAARSGLPAS